MKENEYLFERQSGNVHIIAIDDHEGSRAHKLFECDDCRSYMPHDCRFGIWRGATPTAALAGTRFAHLTLVS